MEKIRAFFEVEKDNAVEATFRIHEEITCSSKYPTMVEVKENATEEAFLIGVCSFIIHLCEYHGAYSVFESNHNVAPYVADSLKKLGYEEEGESFQRIMDVFPVFTDFHTEYRTQEYCDIINALEGRKPDEDCEEKRLLQLSEEELDKMNKDYEKTNDDFDTLIDEKWRTDISKALKKVEDFARKNFDTNIWK